MSKSNVFGVSEFSVDMYYLKKKIILIQCDCHVGKITNVY